MGLDVITLGCRLNLWESEVMRGLAAGAGIAEAVIVNTCAVTAEAERQARQAIRRAHRERPGTPILVTGCAAELAPADYAGLPGVTRVLGNAEKLAAAAWRGTSTERSAEAPALDRFATHTRGFVQVQQGCDHRCTFCVIPYARGASRSVPLGQVVDWVRRLTDQGHREIVLTGVDLTAWGRDLPGRPAFGQLLRRLLALVPGLERLRLSSVDPAELDEEFWRLVAEEKRLMPHLHLSAQAGDDKVLKQMKRRHGRDQLIAVAERARALRPGIALGADLIAGFPTESEGQFANSLDLVEAAGLDYLHVFPYSPRPGTPAARLKPLPGPVVAARAKALREAGAARLRRRLDGLVGTSAGVLMERGGTGRTECFAPVRPDHPLPAGTLARLRLTAVAEGKLVGAAA